MVSQGSSGSGYPFCYERRAVFVGFSNCFLSQFWGDLRGNKCFCELLPGYLSVFVRQLLIRFGNQAVYDADYLMHECSIGFLFVRGKMKRKRARTCLFGIVGVFLLSASELRADLLGYWSADLTQGTTDLLVNDLDNSFLLGMLVGGATYSADGEGHTGQPGDYAISFPGQDADYATIPPTEETFEEATITAWVKGAPAGDWAAVISSRDASQPLYMGFTGGTTDLAYVWNDNSNQTWGWGSELTVPPDEWTFVALTITEDAATLYVGPDGETLESAVNEIPHFPQENLTEWRLAEDNCCGTERNFAGLIDDVSIWDEALIPELLDVLHQKIVTPLELFLGPTESLCDFDGNDTCTIDDMDMLLYDGLVNGGAQFDLDGSGAVDAADVDEWLTIAGQENLGIAYVRGDTDFDGDVDAADLNNVGQNWRLPGAISWGQGDFDGSGLVDASDLNSVGINWQHGVTAPATAAIPEPSSFGLATIIGLLLAGCRSRRT